MSVSAYVARPHPYHTALPSSSSGVMDPPTFAIPSSSFNSFPANPDPGDAHLHATLQRIDQLANEDVEMHAPLAESSTFLVLDTNILIHHFDVITQFVEDAERQSLPLVVIIPGAVIYELDGQKNRDGLAWFARRASAWLLKKVKERKMVKGQANEETCRPSGNWKIRVPGEDFGTERMNDALILDCCVYFRRWRRTFLCSSDKNLCIETENATAGIPTLSPTRNWSSREIAFVIFGEYGIDLSRFAAYRISYKDPTSNVAALSPAVEYDDDMMAVDDDASMTHVLLPSHALDLLHIQVIDHFTRLLVELVGRVGGPEIHQAARAGDGTSASRYAPQWQRQGRHYLEWTAADVLEYLDHEKKIPATSPRVAVFLSMPYSNRGARRGQDWSRRDWEVALAGLGRIGDMWEEPSIGESLRVLERHVEGIFATKMRPTGI
ncbi:putative large family of predicted nucleotide-binding domains containing protein [Lyophyllum shimeji]|uniref:Large family of predicted nucleotide-binding domains containing protein n=1 Tax=Lyophyllum shimeji TaxID=47721 RepID=A0A9P3PDE5_LYOSH|nr:putative large family of predicted nucleotide-binding domains containing protein [Lyophyllum shimeji]